MDENFNYIELYKELRTCKDIIKSIEPEFLFNFGDYVLSELRQLEKENCEVTKKYLIAQGNLEQTKDELRDYIYNYIPKSKIEEKIEEYRNKAQEYINQKEYNQADIKMFYIYTLENLLKSE